MANLVDSIQRHLVGLLNRAENGIIEVQRNELATIFGCVPSQINYVLETRFTAERGYLVESRRGGGGYIRIIRLRLDPDDLVYEILNKAVGEAISQDVAYDYVERLAEAGHLTEREAAMLQAALHRTTLVGDANARDRQRARLLKAMLLALAKFY